MTDLRISLPVPAILDALQQAVAQQPPQGASAQEPAVTIAPPAPAPLDAAGKRRAQGSTSRTPTPPHERNDRQEQVAAFVEDMREIRRERADETRADEIEGHIAELDAEVSSHRAPPHA